jgi:hypothetical protein
MLFGLQCFGLGSGLSCLQWFSLTWRRLSPTLFFFQYTPTVFPFLRDPPWAFATLSGRFAHVRAVPLSGVVQLDEHILHPYCDDLPCRCFSMFSVPLPLYLNDRRVLAVAHDEQCAARLLPFHRCLSCSQLGLLLSSDVLAVQIL